MDPLTVLIFLAIAVLAVWLVRAVR